MLKDLLLKRSRKFLLSVGDDGAVLVYLVGGQVEGRFFFNNVESIDIDKVFAGDVDAPISILVDVADQSYLQHSLPPVSSLNVQKMVARRLEKEFDRDDIKGAIFLNRSTTGRKDWNYLFASIRNVSPLSDWIEKLGGYPNSIEGIYLLPVETEPLVRAIKKAVEVENVATKSQWQMLVTHNKTGGLRQVVYRDGRILFTRLAQPVGGNAAGVIAGHIEQETLNTLEYVRRMNFDDKDGLDIIIITSADVKKQLEASRFKATNLYVLTPHEVSNLLGLERATEVKDKFFDVVNLAYFGRNGKHILKLTTPLLQKTRQMEIAKVATIAFAYIFVPLAILFTLYNIYTSLDLHGRTKTADVELQKVKAEQQTLEKRNAANAERKAEVEAMVLLYEQYSKDAIVPFNFLTKLSEVKGQVALLQDLNFGVTETVAGPQKTVQTGINFAAQIIYPNKAETPQAHISAVESFAKIIREAFPSVAVNFSGLPSQQDFKISVEGGPSAIGAAPKDPTKKEDTTLGLSIIGVIDEDLRRKQFMLPQEDEKTKTQAPLQTLPMEKKP